MLLANGVLWEWPFECSSFEGCCPYHFSLCCVVASRVALAKGRLGTKTLTSKRYNQYFTVKPMVHWISVHSSAFYTPAFTTQILQLQLYHVNQGGILILTCGMGPSWVIGWGLTTSNRWFESRNFSLRQPAFCAKCQGEIAKKIKMTYVFYMFFFCAQFLQCYFDG